MDQLIIPILLLLVFAAILSAIVLPIIALVISIRSRKKITEQVSRLQVQSPPLTSALIEPPVSGQGHLAAAIRQLNTRVEKLEAALAAHSIRIPDVGDD